MFTEISSNTQTYIINTDQLTYITEDCLHFSDGSYLKTSEETTKDLITKLATKTKGVKNRNIDKELEDLFYELHTLTGGKGKPTFNLVREKKLKFLLDKNKGGLTKEKLLIAAKNIGNNAWLQGDNPQNERYGKIDYLLRPEKATQYSEQEEKKKKGMF